MREKVIYYHRMYKRVRVIVKRKSTEKREKAKETCIAANISQRAQKSTTNKEGKQQQQIQKCMQKRAVRRNARLPDVLKR